MLTIDYSLGPNTYELTPYTTSQEKDLLLLSTIGADSLDRALRVCGFNTALDGLTKELKVALLFKYREISTGSDLRVSFTCCKCGERSDNVIDVEMFCSPGTANASHCVDQYTELTHENIQSFTSIDVDDVDVDDYDALFNEVSDSVWKFNWELPTVCLRCNTKNGVSVRDNNFVINSMSEDSLMSLYQTYNDLVAFGNYSKLDVDSMYPFERTIFASIVEKTKERNP